MIDWDKPLQTKKGRKAVIYTTEGKDPEHPIVGDFWSILGYWETAHWTKEGRFFSGGEESDFDLMNVPGSPRPMPQSSTPGSKNDE